jgi:serine/threonine protein kinase
MALTDGTRIGPYEVTSRLGEGGMGVVFRAHDTKLQRDVALKLLPDHFANDPERLARFQREAQVLASLNHPHIAQIYGLEDSTAQRCIVMELVGGETLQERFSASPVTGLGANKHEYVVTRDGRFLVNQQAEASTTTPITLILNFQPPQK